MIIFAIRKILARQGYECSAVVAVQGWPAGRRWNDFHVLHRGNADEPVSLYTELTIYDEDPAILFVSDPHTDSTRIDLADPHSFEQLTKILDEHQQHASYLTNGRYQPYNP